MNFICAGNTLGPLVCGFVITGLSWRWHKWIAVILTGINFLTVLLFVPETRYYRNGNGDGTGQSEQPVLSSTETMGGDGEAAKESRVEPEGKNEEAHDTPTTVPKKTWIQELSLWSGTAPDTNLAKMFIRPLPMFAYPCVIYSLFGYATSLVLTMAVNILNPFVLQAPPYSWSPMINGLINIPGFIGNVVGSYAGGWLVDVFCDWKTRRNKGVFEPESRLYLCALPLFVTGAGCIVFGYGVERMLHWTSLFIAYGMISVALTAIPTITMAYVSDCLLPVNSDALMLVNGMDICLTTMHPNAR
jgi:MFS family permease